MAIKSEGNHARRPRRNHTPAFKSKVALAAGKGDQTIVELSQQFDVHVNQITQWKTRLLERAGVVFEGGGRAESPPVDLEALEEAIACYGPLEIMNTDQGGQFTSQAFTGVVKDHGIRIAWTGRVPGVIMYSLNDCGARSSMKKFISMPATRSLTLELAWVATLICIIEDGHTPAREGRHRTRYIFLSRR